MAADRLNKFSFPIGLVRILISTRFYEDFTSPYFHLQSHIKLKKQNMSQPASIVQYRLIINPYSASYDLIIPQNVKALNLPDLCRISEPAG